LSLREIKFVLYIQLLHDTEIFIAMTVNQLLHSGIVFKYQTLPHLIKYIRSCTVSDVLLPCVYVPMIFLYISPLILSYLASTRLQCYPYTTFIALHSHKYTRFSLKHCTSLPSRSYSNI